ncbi:conserved hypothetical protein [Uncinocarpus reesii 1704]|uniref:G-patch domain-containing protein n=1 Tax=Uncinocarpus reesii (strain UAMH 1704) TaxID=336963 RepID=C4JSW8_UNCRE|nr:uncharacterized protein UREG_05557 [Uncinocarpus reesii 1704]EEP80715.1 conserved hypothetical protein [Uncinocarpus reesii 1704]
MAAPPTGPKSGLSLYANLLDPSDASSGSNTISRAPVVFKQAADGGSQEDDAASKKQQISAASLRFQPTKRPQLPSQKLKAKPAIPKPPVVSAATSPANHSTTSGPAADTIRPPAKTTLADWAATAEDDDINGFYGEKRQRGGRKRRKKNRDAEVVYNWDDIYDPSRPNSYDAYRHSEEKIREVREWKDRLYAHRMARRTSSEVESDDEYRRRPMNSSSRLSLSRVNLFGWVINVLLTPLLEQFAPPKQFAPPPNLNDIPRQPSAPNSPVTEVAPPPAAPLPDDQTGEDAFARRLRLSQNTGQEPSMAPVQPPSLPPPPPPPEDIPSVPTPKEVYSAATISRAPVRYTLPPAPEDIPATEEELEATFAKETEEVPEEDAPRSLRPGQKGFAERLLAKYGWTKGSGLGASGTGIINPLQVKVEKQKKRPDAEGGGFVTPAGRGKIIGGKQKKQDEGKFGAMSEVIVLHGMVDGMDLNAELEAGEDGGLIQEIGEECGEKYGRVERVFVDRNSEGQVPVFVKFTNQLSALRAVNALEGRVFNGNTITARFFDVEKFEEGIYK